MQELMWDETSGLFCDYDWVHRQRNPHPSLAGFYPLWAGLATPEQARRLVQDWLPQFEHPGGLVTTLQQRAGRQWAYPNGWAPLHWLVTNGLERYGYHDEAQRIRRKWCENCANVFAVTGTMWEKYNVLEMGSRVEEGIYGSMAGFGWSNAVFVDFTRHLTTTSAAMGARG
jgi:alpha,alpha-trehalase